MVSIADTAQIDDSAQLGDHVTIGPGCVIGPGVILGDHTECKPNVYIHAGVTVGKNNVIFQNSVIGEEPQILNRDMLEAGSVEIGDGNVIRENVTINRGSHIDGGVTRIGHQCYLMAGVHLGHGCDIADNVVISNYTQLSGHVRVEKKAWIGAVSGIHQFATVGCYSYIGGASAVVKDVPPFVRVAGAYPCEEHGLNLIGLQRAGFEKSTLSALKKVYLDLYKHREGKSFLQVLEQWKATESLDSNVQYLVDFIDRSCQHRFGRYLELKR